jgi:hypothetical protein
MNVCCRRPFFASLAILAAACGLAATRRAAAEPPAKIDMEELARTGSSSWQQWRRSNAQWSVTAVLPSGVTVAMDVIRTPFRQRMILRAETKDRREELVRVIQRDGAWYCQDGGGLSKWRPYELPTESVLFYAMLSRATPTYVDAETVQRLGRVRRIDAGNVGTFMSKLDEASAAAIRGNLVLLEQVLLKNEQNPMAPKLRENIDQLRSFISDGTPIQVDLNTGQIIDMGAERFHTQVTSVKLLKEVDDAVFGVDVPGDPHFWEGARDKTQDPTTSGDVNKLAMIAQFRAYQPELKQYELDGRLVDLNTMRVRRIPYEGPVCAPGCFTQDRKSVVVGGTTANGSVRPFLVNLSTGVNRGLGGQLLDGTSTVAMALAPDGRQIAAITRVVSGREIENRVYLIDLTSGDASPVGSGVDAGAIQWMPDGKHLLVSAPRQEIPENPMINTLGQMNLDGQFTLMRKHAINAQLLPDHRQILYLNDDDHQWYTCDLAGENPTLFAGGFKGYESPAISPDGKQVIWLKPDAGKPTVPVMFSFGHLDGTLMTGEPGTWGLSVWK